MDIKAHSPARDIRCIQLSIHKPPQDLPLLSVLPLVIILSLAPQKARIAQIPLRPRSQAPAMSCPAIIHIYTDLEKNDSK